VAALYCIALALRLVPLSFSTLPFNIDGFPLARIAEDLSAQGGWQLDEANVNAYNLRMPAYSVLWASLAQLAGLDPLLHLQAVMPILTAAVVLPAYLLAVRASGSRIAGFGAGLFVAAFGSFLFLTSAAMKEAVGLLVLPMVVLLYAERADARKRGLAVLLLLLLPFLHQLTTFLALGMVSALGVLTQFRRRSRGRFSWRGLALDAATGPGLAAPAWAYYAAVRMPNLDAVTSPDALALFLSITVLLTAALASLPWPVRTRAEGRLVSPANRALVVPVLALAVILVNGRRTLFPGVIGTRPALLEILPAVAALVAFALLGYQLVRRTVNRGHDLVLAMLVAPFALLVFAFLRGLDPLSQTLAYRAFDFLDYALAALVGIGLAFLWRHLREVRTAQVALAAGLLGLLLATTPMAWDSQAVFGVDNVTRPEEFQALALLASLPPGRVTTDQRLGDVGAWWFGLSTDLSLPWRLRDNASLEGFDYALVLEAWTTVGAQVHPAPNIVLSRGTLDAFLSEHRVLYAAGRAGDRVFVVQLTS